MESASIPQLEAHRAPEISTPSDHDAPSATAAILAASSNAPTAAQVKHNGLLARIRRLPTTIAHTFLPTSIRETYTTTFNNIHIKFKTWPIAYRYIILALITLLISAELQQPGFFPRPGNLTNGIIGFLCGGALILGAVALLEWFETSQWPWQQDGWVWPWQKWLWKETIYDFSSSVATSAYGLTSPRSPFTTPPSQNNSSPLPATPDTTMSSSPTPVFNHPLIIPPTPFLPRGLRPVYLPPPPPAEQHHSGLLGESPMAPRFKHFSGEGFRSKQIGRAHV